MPISDVCLEHARPHVVVVLALVDHRAPMLAVVQGAARALLVVASNYLRNFLATFASFKTFQNPFNASHYVATTKAEMVHLWSLSTLRNIQLP